MHQKTLWLAALLAAFTPLRADPTPDSVTIPLTLEQLSNGAYKLGISISLGGGAFKLYEFDTGANGFYAANNTAWWSNFTASPTQVTQTYASGISYNATIVTTTLDFGYGLPVVTANMGQIQSASGSAVPDWDAKVAADIPPLWEYFFGDFGSALGHNNGLFAILPQLPGNLANGFVIRTGGFASPNPTLQIGISDADRALFPYAAPMQGASNTTVFPNSGLDTYQGRLLTGNASFFNGTQTADYATDFIIDTGAPSMVIFDGANITLPSYFLDGNSSVIAGINTTISSGNFSLSFPAGNISGFNLVSEAPGASGGDINTGLIPFFQYDVMFDVQQGYVRFAPVTVPEPATATLLAGGVLGLAVLLVRRRR